MAPSLGAHRFNLRLRAGDLQSELRHQRHRKRELQFAQTHQDTRRVSHRCSSNQITVLGFTQYRQMLDDANPELETGDASAYDSF